MRRTAVLWTAAIAVLAILLVGNLATSAVATVVRTIQDVRVTNFPAVQTTKPAPPQTSMITFCSNLVVKPHSEAATAVHAPVRSLVGYRHVAFLTKIRPADGSQMPSVHVSMVFTDVNPSTADPGAHAHASLGTPGLFGPDVGTSAANMDVPAPYAHPLIENSSNVRARVTVKAYLTR